MLTSSYVFANVSYPSNLWKGIVAESASEGYKGMYAVTCVYKNRLKKGMKLGCVGLQRKDLDRFVSQQGAKVSLQAQQAVLQVFEKGYADITNGATHYENLEFGKPYWFKDMIITQVIGKHTFMKEK